MFKNNLKIARIQKGIPQWKLARYLEIFPQKLSMIETGRLKATDKIKKACCEALQMTEEELFPKEKIL